MALDPDLVRIDLLRVKRKLFLQYQEGSKERQDFVVASKLSELGYLSKLADPATVRSRTARSAGPEQSPRQRS